MIDDHSLHNDLDLTEEELDKLIQGVSISMSDKGSSLINLKPLSDEDLGNLSLRIQEEQERRKWERIHALLQKHIFSLPLADLYRIQDYIQKEIHNREVASSSVGGNFDGSDGNQFNGKDVLTGQFGSDWAKRSSSQDTTTIDVEVSS